MRFVARVAGIDRVGSASALDSSNGDCGSILDERESPEATAMICGGLKVDSSAFIDDLSTIRRTVEYDITQLSCVSEAITFRETMLMVRSLRIS